MTDAEGMARILQLHRPVRPRCIEEHRVAICTCRWRAHAGDELTSTVHLRHVADQLAQTGYGRTDPTWERCYLADNTPTPHEGTP